MTATLNLSQAEIWWSTTFSRRFLVIALLPFLIVGPLLTALGGEEPPRSVWLVAPLAIAIAALQLRHSLAAAAGDRPKGWPITLFGLTMLIYTPLPWFQWDWATTQWMFMASVAMLIRGRAMTVLVIVPLLGTAAVAVIDASHTGGTFPLYVYLSGYWLTALAGGTVCLYGASQLVRAVDQLFATRADLATVAVGREQLRLSRDLHDLLGQSLSAISLKGDLAVALTCSEPQAAEIEIESIIEVAREALRDAHHVVYGRYPMTLRSETGGAAALLAAASISAHIDVDLPDLAPQVDALFGWATREGVTNMVRHSQAGTCSIRATRRLSSALLEIVNDGARSTSGAGTGIASLTERAQTLSGHVEAGLLRDGRYRLAVEVPEAFV